MTVPGSGWANSLKNSHSPRAANASMSWWTTSSMWGTSSRTRRGLNTRFTIRRYRVCSGGSVRWRVDRWLQPRSAKARRRRSESSACRPLEMFDWEEKVAGSARTSRQSSHVVTR